METKGRIELQDYLLLAAVLALPWAFGGVDAWASRTASFLIVAAASVTLAREGFAGLGWQRKSLWLAPALLLAAWGAAQLVPLPSSWIRVLSPEAYRIYSEALPGYPETGAPDALSVLEERALALVPEAGVESPRPAMEPGLPQGPLSCASSLKPLSLQPTRTAERLFWYVALLLGFLMLRQRVVDRGRYRLYRAAILLNFGGLAAFALLQAQGWNGKLYWLRPVLSDAQPLGPYFSRPHFGGLMEMAVPWLAGFSWSRFRRSGRSALYQPGAVGSAVAAILCTVAALASAAKFVAFIVVLSLGLLCSVGIRTLWGRIAMILAAVLLVALSGPFLEGTALGQRVDSYLDRVTVSNPLQERGDIVRASLPIVEDFTLTGSGFGTFRELFPYYRPAGERGRFGRAHNDYLELLVTGGAVAAVLALWLFAAFWFHAISFIRESRSGLSLSRVGLALGVAALMLHGLTDFNHQIPANGLAFVAMCAMLVPADGEGEDSGS